MISRNGKIYASFESAVLVGKILYYVEMNGNEIYKYNIPNEKLDLLCVIEEEKDYEERLFSSVVYKDGKLYLIPFAPDCIYIVDADSGEYTRKDLGDICNKRKGEYISTAKWSAAVEYENKIYLIPASFPGIVVYDISHDTLTVIDSWINDVKDNSEGKESAYFKNAKLFANKIFMPMCKMNGVLVYDIMNEQYEVKVVGEKNCSYSDICFDGECFWLSPRGDGSIVKWDYITNKYKEIQSFPQLYRKGSTLGVTYWKQNVIVFPQNSNMFLAIDILNNEMTEWHQDLNGTKVFWKSSTEEKLCFFEADGNQLFIIDNDEKKVMIQYDDALDEFHKKNISKIYRTKMQQSEIKGIYQEDYSNALNDFLSLIV